MEWIMYINIGVVLLSFVISERGRKLKSNSEQDKPSPPSKLNALLPFLAVLLIPVNGSFLVLQGLYRIHFDKVAKNTRAVVTHSGGRRSLSDDEENYESFCLYTFKVGSRSYKGEGLKIFSDEYSANTHAKQLWKVGIRISVRYDPGDPARNALSGGVPSESYSPVELLIGNVVMIILLIKYLWWHFSSRPGRLKKP